MAATVASIRGVVFMARSSRGRAGSFHYNMLIISHVNLFILLYDHNLNWRALSLRHRRLQCVARVLGISSFAFAVTAPLTLRISRGPCSVRGRIAKRLGRSGSAAPAVFFLLCHTTAICSRRVYVEPAEQSRSSARQELRRKISILARRTVDRDRRVDG
jgi:hypothetical protein